MLNQTRIATSLPTHSALTNKVEQVTKKAIQDLKNSEGVVLQAVGHYIEYLLHMTERVKFEIGGLYQYNVLKLITLQEAKQIYKFHDTLQADIFTSANGEKMVTLYRTILTKFPQKDGDNHPGYQKPVSRVVATDHRVLNNLATKQRENMKVGLVSFIRKQVNNKTVVHTKKTSSAEKFTFNDFSDDEDLPPFKSSPSIANSDSKAAKPKKELWKQEKVIADRKQEPAVKKPELVFQKPAFKKKIKKMRHQKSSTWLT